MTEQELAENKLDERLEAKRQEQLERYNRRTGVNCSRLGYYEATELKRWDKIYNQDWKPSKDFPFYLTLFCVRFCEFILFAFVVMLPYFFRYDWEWLPRVLGIASILWLINAFFRKKFGIYLLNFAPDLGIFLEKNQRWLKNPDKFYEGLEEQLGCPVKREYPSDREKARFLKTRASVAI